ncbi:MAG: DUF2878 domain-containing protein [Xanthomonadaceae bacterium]|nr:DUF2878 domain-containing protein [Xanthomonadaceae bacterium]
MKNRLLGLVGYQAVWLIAVIGAGHDRWWPGPLALLPFAAWQITRSSQPRAELRLLLTTGLLGCLLDSLYAGSGVLAFAAALPTPALAPIWIIAIWMAFALTLTTTFRFLDGHPWVAALLGAIGAPLSYLAAARGWHAVTFPHGEAAAMAALAAGWALALPVALRLATWAYRSDRPRPALRERAAR